MEQQAETPPDSPVIGAKKSGEPAAVVSDANNRDRDLVRRALKELGYDKCLTVKSSKEAVEIIQDGRGDILVVDAQNAEMSGLDVLKALKGDPKTSSVPIILTSFLKTAEDIVQARESGADGYVVKPVTTAAIINQTQGAAKSRVEEARKERKAKQKEIESKDMDLAQEAKEKAGVYVGVIKMMEIHKRHFPFHVPTYIEIGKLLLRLGSGGKAAPYLRQALKLSPNAPLPLGLLADHYVNEEDYENALKFAKQCASASGKKAAYEKLGEIQLKAGKLNEAIVTFNSVVTMTEAEEEAGKQTLSKGLNLRGQAYRAKGEKEGNENFMNRAAKDFEKSADLDPDFLAASYNLMVTYKKMGQNDKAMQVFEKIKTKEPKDVESWLALAEAYHNDDDTAKTAFALDRALKMKWTEALMRKRIVDLYIKYGLMEKAETVIEKILKETPKEIHFMNKLGIIHRRMGHPAKAVAQYKRAIEIDPEDAGIWYNLSRALKDEEKIEEAREAFDKCKQVDPEFDHPF